MKTTVLIADAARARFFRVAEAGDDDYEAGPRLREQEVLVNPEAQLTGSDQYANLKSGRKRATGGGAAHGLDDHRERHDHEVDKRFAKRLAKATDEHTRKEQTERLVIVAPPKALGVIRPALADALHTKVEIVTLDKEMSWHALSHIEDVLEKKGLLGARVLPSSVRRAGQPQSD